MVVLYVQVLSEAIVTKGLSKLGQSTDGTQKSFLHLSLPVSLIREKLQCNVTK